MDNKKYTVTVVDDHPAIAVAIEAVLAESEFMVRDVAENGADAITLIKDNPPDYVILDIGLPGMDGLTVMQRLNHLGVKTNYLVFTSYGGSPDIVRRCLRAGAKGVVNKSQSIQDILVALTALKNHVTYFPSQIVAVFASSKEEAFRNLSNREFTIFRKLVLGKASKEIAQELMLSEKTVSTYKTRLLKKLNVKTVIDLKRLATGAGLDELEDFLDKEVEEQGAKIIKAKRKLSNKEDNAS